MRKATSPAPQSPARSPRTAYASACVYAVQSPHDEVIVPVHHAVDAQRAAVGVVALGTDGVQGVLQADGRRVGRAQVDQAGVRDVIVDAPVEYAIAASPRAIQGGFQGGERGGGFLDASSSSGHRRDKFAAIGSQRHLAAEGLAMRSTKRAQSPTVVRAIEKVTGIVSIAWLSPMPREADGLAAAARSRIPTCDGREDTPRLPIFAAMISRSKCVAQHALDYLACPS